MTYLANFGCLDDVLDAFLRERLRQGLHDGRVRYPMPRDLEYDEEADARAILDRLIAEHTREVQP